MSARERLFGTYPGALTPPARKPFVIARYALGRMFASRLFVAFFLACYIPSLVLMGIARMHYSGHFIPIPPMISLVLSSSIWVSFLVVLVAGPALIASDIANNAMPLYLSRGLRKQDYVLGKLLALFATAAAVTWMPGVLVILVCGQYEPARSLLTDLRLALALAATSLVWVGCLAMIALAISAWVKTRPAATLGFLGLFVVAEVSGDILEARFGGWVGSAFDLTDAVEVVGRTLYGISAESPLPAWAAWAMLLLSTIAAAAALFRRIRAVEVAA